VNAWEHASTHRPQRPGSGSAAIPTATWIARDEILLVDALKPARNKGPRSIGAAVEAQAEQNRRVPELASESQGFNGVFGRGSWIRTNDLQ
jgi:hypothetical protein